MYIKKALRNSNAKRSRIILYNTYLGRLGVGFLLFLLARIFDYHNLSLVARKQLYDIFCVRKERYAERVE